MSNVCTIPKYENAASWNSVNYSPNVLNANLSIEAIPATTSNVSGINIPYRMGNLSILQARSPSRTSVFDYLPLVGCSSSVSTTVRENGCEGDPPVLMRNQVRYENAAVVLPFMTQSLQSMRVYAICENRQCSGITEERRAEVFRQISLVSDRQTEGAISVSVNGSNNVFCCYLDSMIRCPSDVNHVENTESLYSFILSQGAWVETNLVEIQTR